VDTTTPFRRGSSLLTDSRPYGIGGSSDSFTQDGNIGMNYAVNSLRTASQTAAAPTTAIEPAETKRPRMAEFS
jgi:hypothetical protein